MRVRFLLILSAITVCLAMVAGISSAAPAKKAKAAVNVRAYVHFYEADGVTRTGAGATLYCQNASTGATGTSTTDGFGNAQCWVPQNSCYWFWGTFPQNYYWGHFNGSWAVYACYGNGVDGYNVYLKLIRW